MSDWSLSKLIKVIPTKVLEQMSHPLRHNVWPLINETVVLCTIHVLYSHFKRWLLIEDDVNTSALVATFSDDTTSVQVVKFLYNFVFDEVDNERRVRIQMCSYVNMI